MNLTRNFLWRKVREQKILAIHRRVAKVCQTLIKEYHAHPEDFGIKPKKDFDNDMIIWQYWAQGYDQVPEVVRQCLASVDRWAGDYKIIRLSDANLSEYLDIPEFVLEKRPTYSLAHFADLLRLMLLKTYGGIWFDATVYLSGSIPENYVNCSLFFFRRDLDEPHYRYWRNTYAYYFGWAKGFRVNMLNSILFAKAGNQAIAEMCDMMLLWWKNHDDIPDYFFFQILFDVYGYPVDTPLVSDTLPHYLQQSINDPKFYLMSREEILASIPMHKLTYK